MIILLWRGCVGGGLFDPDDDITREQMATMLWRYAKLMGMDVISGENTSTLRFTDASSASEYAIPALQWACAEGIVTGKPGGIIDPRGNATRAEVTAMLHRFLELK